MLNKDELKKKEHEFCHDICNSLSTYAFDKKIHVSSFSLNVLSMAIAKTIALTVQVYKDIGIKKDISEILEKTMQSIRFDSKMMLEVFRSENDD